MHLDMMFIIQQWPLNLFDHYIAYWEHFMASHKAEEPM